MKKVFNLLLALLLLLGVVGCKIESDLNVPTPKPKGTGIEILLNEKTSDTTKVTINRKLSTEADYNTSNYRISVGNLQDVEKVTDYFVEPNISYDYKIIYQNNNWETIKETEVKNKTSSDGLGEFLLAKDLSASYDDTTGIMTLSPNPKINESLYFEHKNNFSINYNIIYSLKDNGNRRWFKINQKDGTIDFLLNMEDEQFLNKPLTLNGAYQNIHVDGINYEYSITPEQLKSHISNIPNTIKVPDLRTTITAAKVENGIKITLPNLTNNKTYKYVLCRKTSDSRYDEILSTTNLNKKELIDYTTESGKSYTYILKYKDMKDNTILCSKPTAEVIATSGLGTPTIDYTKKPSYSEDTGIMTFPSFFGLERFLDLPKASMNVEVYYGADGIGGFWTSINNKKQINFIDEIKNFSDKYSYLGKKLTKEYVNLDYHLIIDDVEIEYKMEDNHWVKVRNMFPETIKIPDLSPECKTDFNGVTLTIKNIPEETTNIFINRKLKDNPNTNSNYTIRISEWNDYKIPSEISITDYFVNSNTDYIYDVRVFNDSWDNITLLLKPIEITTIGGVGELKLDRNPIASYYSETGIMKFENLPQYETTIEDWINNNEADKWFNISYIAKKDNGEYNWDCQAYDSVSNKIDYSKYTETIPYYEPLYLRYLDCYVRKDNVDYNLELNDNTVSGIPYKIYIPRW